MTTRHYIRLARRCWQICAFTRIEALAIWRAKAGWYEGDERVFVGANAVPNSVQTAMW